MRRLLLTVIVFMAVGWLIPLKSQVLSNFEFGAKLSSSLGTIAVDYTNFSKLKPGYTMGIFAKYAIADPLSVSLGFDYAQSGAKMIDPYLVYSDGSPLVIDENRMDFSFNTISMPLLFNFLVNPDGGIGIKAIAGSAMNFINKANSITYNTVKVDEDMPYITSNDITDRIKGTSFMAILGVGALVDADPIMINADLSYQMGIKNLNNVRGNPYFYNNQIVLSLNIGFAL